MKLLKLLLILLPSFSWAIGLEEVSIEYNKYLNGRNLLLYPEAPTQSLSFNLDTSLNKFFWDNEIKSYTDKNGFRSIAWEFYLGYNIYNTIDVFYRHESQHVLDKKHSFADFPYENSFGLRLYIHKNERR